MSKDNIGSDRLIPKEEWIDKRHIQGDEYKVMNNPTIHKAFNRILELHKPHRKIALVSLCTSSRPYSTSAKWKKFIELFGDNADLIVCSNGGIIPMEFWNCYPFLTYDAHGQAKYDRYYIRYVYNNLMKFFNKFHYDKIVFNFRPGLRNRIAAEAFRKNYKGTSQIVILPTEKAYREAQRAGFPAGKMFPDLDPRVLKELKQEIN